MSPFLRHQMFAWSLTASMILLTHEAATAGIAGRVQQFDGSALAGATVEVWDQYPIGNILEFGTTDELGAFSIGGIEGVQHDLRVCEKGFYPTVVRSLLNATMNTIVRLKRTPDISRNPNTCDYWGDATTFLNSPLRAGDVVECVSQDGRTCGLGGMQYLPGVYLLHAFGDDPAIHGIDGPTAGEPVAFRINGFDASLDNSPVVFQPLASTEVKLTGPSNVPGVLLSAPVSAEAGTGGSVYITLNVTNTGNTAGHFNVQAELDQLWIVEMQPANGNGLELQSGESANVLVRIGVPAGTPDTVVTVRYTATSEIYNQANSGAWTELFVSTITSVGGDVDLIPYSFDLAQNYPNPFNANTTIAFSLEAGGHVQLRVYNLVGQSLRTLVSGYREAGAYTESWDGRDDNDLAVPSGLYFSRLMQNEQSTVRKMVLLR